MQIGQMLPLPTQQPPLQLAVAVGVGVCKLIHLLSPVAHALQAEGIVCQEFNDAAEQTHGWDFEVLYDRVLGCCTDAGSSGATAATECG